ncbi:hypothetical protein JST97_21030 [bacterium]|nr:hypothetical protein [bacterium]
MNGPLGLLSQRDGWGRSLSFSLSRIVLEMMSRLEVALQTDLGIGCRHLGLLIWLEREGGMIAHFKPHFETNLSPDTLQAIKLFQLLFWGFGGSTLEVTPEVANLLDSLEARGLVSQSFGSDRRSLHITSSGRDLCIRGWKLVTATEQSFFELSEFQILPYLV